MLALRRFDQQISCFCAAACACRLQQRWQQAMRWPEDRRIFTMGWDEWLL